MTLKINNRDARKLWLSAQGLGSAPTGALDVLQIIKDLGFVQLDTIRNVARAHHHILWSRNQKYREPMLGKLLGSERAVFEHFTHDASVLPMDFYPMWRRQFQRLKDHIDRSNYYKSMPDEAGRQAIKARIAQEGPLSTKAFDTKAAGAKKMWSRPPHKLALDYMWYAGELATSHRKDFRKFYGLAEHIIPRDIRSVEHTDQYQIDWLCHAALERLAFGTLGDIRRFWEATEQGEVKSWAENAGSAVVPVAYKTMDGGWIEALAPADIEQRLAHLPAQSSRIKILNPFDPAIRDRARLARLFGFEYRIEIFVPASKRKWGYYVYPLLQADRFVGRIEVKADRKAQALSVIGFWPEAEVKWTPKRWGKLDAELTRLTRLVGANTVTWACARPKGEN
ncbi:MAG: winged helix-turn-helix domain-containing protein [Alphaproteobacteria bacterium]